MAVPFAQSSSMLGDRSMCCGELRATDRAYALLEWIPEELDLTDFAD